MRKITQNSEENRANLKVFNSFQDEYKVILGDLLKEVSLRDEAIEHLTTKLSINDQRHREFRFVFGNVGIVEDKLRKLEALSTEKIFSCFDHYARSINQVDKECKKVTLVASKLKEENQISPGKAAGMLNDVHKNLNQVISCFEKFFNKFRSVQQINDLVSSYMKGKEEIRKNINKVIYLGEMAKIKEKRGHTPSSEFLRNGYHESMDQLDYRFSAFNKDLDKEQSKVYAPKIREGHLRQNTAGLSPRAASKKDVELSHAAVSKPNLDKSRISAANFVIKNKPSSSVTVKSLKSSMSESILKKKS